MEVLRLKELLTEKNMSTKDFAEVSGLSYTYASEVVRNVKFPRKETLIEIASKLNVDIRDLFHPSMDVSGDIHDLYVKGADGQFIKVGSINQQEVTRL